MNKNTFRIGTLVVFRLPERNFLFRVVGEELPTKVSGLGMRESLKGADTADGLFALGEVSIGEEMRLRLDMLGGGRLVFLFAMKAEFDLRRIEISAEVADNLVTFLAEWPS